MATKKKKKKPPVQDESQEQVKGTEEQAATKESAPTEDNDTIAEQESKPQDEAKGLDSNLSAAPKKSGVSFDSQKRKLMAEYPSLIDEDFAGDGPEAMIQSVATKLGIDYTTMWNMSVS